MKERNIIVTIKNKHLDALEDLLYCELTQKKKVKYSKQAKKLWVTLVKAYNKKK